MTLHELKISSKNHPRLIHGSKIPAKININLFKIRGIIVFRVTNTVEQVGFSFQSLMTLKANEVFKRNIILIGPKF